MWAIFMSHLNLPHNKPDVRLVNGVHECMPIRSISSGMETESS